MKISALEKWTLALTAVFLLVTVGSFLGQRLSMQTYTVSENIQWTLRVGDRTKSSVAAHDRININTATAEQLQSLPGIGQVRAQEIVADRRANGPFRIPEDITRVSGIGQGTLDEILDYITVK